MANKMVIKVEVDAKDVARGVATAKGEVQGLQKEIDKTDKASVQAAAAFGKYAAVAAAGFAAKAVKDQMELAKAIREVQIQSGATLQQAASLNAQMEVLGVPVDALSGAFRVLAANMQSSPEMFRELGIATTDASGAARSAFDVFMDVRKVLADSNGDAATLAAANSLLGRGYQDLLPLLGATDDELRTLSDAAQTSGIIMGQDAVQGAEQLGDALNGASISVQGLAQNIAENLIPMLTQMAEAAAVGIDTLNALMNTRTHFISESDSKIPIVGGIANIIGGLIDTATGTPSDQLRKVNDQVNAQEKARAAIEAILTRQRASLGTTRSGASLGGRIGSSQAGVDAMKAEAEDAMNSLRDHLKTYEREREALIELIGSEAEASKNAHQAEIDRISAVQQAEEDAFHARQRLRDDEIEGLRGELRATEDLKNVEQDRADITAAESDLAGARSRQVFRNQFTSAADYYKAIDQKRRDEEAAERKLADAKKKLADDEARQSIEARIRAIEAQSQLEQRAMEARRRDADDRIKAIRTQMDLEQTAAQAKLDAIHKELGAERDRVNDAIEGIRRHTAEAVAGATAIINALNAIPRSIVTTHTIVTTGGGSGGGGTTTTGPGSTEPVGGGDDSTLSAAEAESFIRAAYRDILGRALNADEIPGAWIGRIGQNKQSILSGIFGSPEAAANRTRHAGGGGGGGGGGTFDTPQVARFNEPVLMTGISGRRYGVAAAHGSETVAFGGVGSAAVGSWGRGGTGAGGVNVNVNIGRIEGMTPREVWQKVAPALQAEFESGLEDAIASETTFGYRRS